MKGVDVAVDVDEVSDVVDVVVDFDADGYDVGAMEVVWGVDPEGLKG